MRRTREISKRLGRFRDRDQKHRDQDRDDQWLEYMLFLFNIRLNRD